MRKFLSVILACFMLAHTIPVFAEEEATKPDELYTYVTDVYTGLGIFKKNIGLFEGETVTRADLAKLLYQMLAAAPMVSEQQRHYLDVKPTHEAYHEIETVTQMNILAGVEEGIFQPDKTTTYYEAVKAMVSALGYDYTAKTSGGYPGGYMSVARQKKLLKGIEASGEKEITGRDLAILVYNTLHATVMEGVMEKAGNGSWQEIKVEQEITLLEDVHDIAVVKGVVEATEVSDIHGDDPCDEGKIKIDGQLYETSFAADMLGYLSDAYIQDTDDDDEPDTVIYIGVPSDYNEVITISSDDLEGYEALRYEYGANKRLKLSRDTKILYNGKCMTEYDETLMMPEYGYIEAIRYEDSDEFDVLFIHDINTIVVDQVSVANYVIADRYNKENYIVVDPDDDTKDIKLIENGKEIQFTQLKRDDVLSVEQSQDGMLIRAYRSKAQVTGKINSVGEEELVINGEEYLLIPDVATYADLRYGMDATLLLDINQRVAGKAYAFDTGWRFGVALNVYREDVESIYNLKIFTKDSLEERYPVKEKVVLDGEKFKGTNSEIEERINGQTTKLIRYKVNVNGEISHLDTLTTVTNDKEDDSFTVMHTRSNYYYNASYHTFGATMNVGGNTTVYSVNPIPTGDPEEDFRIISPSVLAGNKSYSAESFTDDKTSLTPDIIFVYQGTTGERISDTARFMPVVGVEEIIKNDDVVTAVRGIYDGYEQSFVVSDKIAIKDVQKGDIIRFSQNAKGIINGYEKVYDAGAQKLAYSENPYNTLGADYCAAIANVWSCKDGQMAITFDESFRSETLPASAKIINLSGAKVYIYELNSKGIPMLTAGTIDDIVGYEGNRAYPSKVLLNSHWFGMTEVYIIKQEV